MARARSYRRREHHFTWLRQALFVVVVAAAVFGALTLFFRISTIEVNGADLYSEEEVLEAAAIEPGRNLFLFNKFRAQRAIISSLPYVQEVRIYRRLPDTVVIDVTESRGSLAAVQDGFCWIISPQGKILEQRPQEDAKKFGALTGVELLAPSVGTRLMLATEFASMQESLVSLMGALGAHELLEQVEELSLADLSYIDVHIAGRFVLRMPYGADYDRLIRSYLAALGTGAIQDNMTGIFDMRSDSGRIHFIQTTQ